MGRFLYLLTVPIVALGIATGLAAADPPLALAPPIETPYSTPPDLPAVSSLDDLYELRDRLQASLDQEAETPDEMDNGVFAPPTELLQMLQATEIRIQVEETARDHWQQAVRSAQQAVTLGQNPEPTLQYAERVYQLWDDAVSGLKAVPEHSFVYEAATQKLGEYTRYLEYASYNYDTARSDFLLPLAEKTGLPSQVHITVCQVATQECRRLRGGDPPASPASLIKVPVAIALMQKVATDNINLDQPIAISQRNYTEDASDIWVGEEYPLRKVLMRMINQSSNVATNQLIDYLGRDYINQVLSDRGYQVTRVNSKLVGEFSYPNNLGDGPNEITTDELSRMMMSIYNQEHPGDDVIIQALMSQEDLVLGHQGLRKSQAIWMGEKTGQNSQALGTTVAFKVKDDYYVASVVLDYSGNEQAIRDVINGIAKHITDNGHL